jgi:N-6 DNA Methylase
MARRSAALHRPSDPGDFLRIVQSFGEELKIRMRGDGRSEDRLRAPVSVLMQRIGELVGMKLTVHDEVILTELRSQPDLAIDSPSGRVGYVELKAPGKGTPDNWRPNAHDRKQWEKLKAMPNLIYTDGSSWALYRQGTLIGHAAKLDGDLASAGRQLRPRDDAFEQLFRAFLEWRPKDPREQVLETLDRERTATDRPFTKLAHEWTTILFPTTNPRQTRADAELTFADSYAQCVTFGLLLARVDGIAFEHRSPAGIAEQLTEQHSLLGEALWILANPRWVRHLNVVDTLVRIIGNIDLSLVRSADSDTYTRLYETFLDEYDHALRRRSGTYYTPIPVARAMVSFVNSVLEDRLKKDRGFASSDVFALDPSMGAGTFLVEILECAAGILSLQRRSIAPHLRDLFARRLIGFEIQTAPFAVAELRLHAALRTRYGIALPDEEPRF